MGKNAWYPLWTTILAAAFLFNKQFWITPQFNSRSVGQVTAVDNTVLFVVEMQHHPIFFLKIKPLKDLELPSHRKDAKKQMRARMGDLEPGLMVSMLHGFSMYGSKFMLYKLECGVRHVTPGKTCRSRDSDCVNNPAPCDL